MTLFSVVMMFCMCPFQLGETRRGTIYGLGNLQYKNKRPSESVPAALKRDIDIEMWVSGLETLSSPHDQPQAPGDAQPQHLITDNHSAFDRWCNAELGL